MTFYAFLVTNNSDRIITLAGQVHKTNYSIFTTYELDYFSDSTILAPGETRLLNSYGGMSLIGISQEYITNPILDLTKGSDNETITRQSNDYLRNIGAPILVSKVSQIQTNQRLCTRNWIGCCFYIENLTPLSILNVVFVNNANYM